MAKELPYFKFEPNQWENGNIQICSREDKGLFLDLCSMYWSRLGDVPLKLAIQKLCGGNTSAFDSLIDEVIFQVVDDKIIIEFLDEQLKEFNNTSNKNRQNALKRWNKNKNNASASKSQSENDTIREDKSKEDKIRVKKTIEDREADFKKSLLPFLEKYGNDILNEFFSYWTEHGEKDRKMRFEKEKSFGISRRLETWLKNKKRFEKEKNGAQREKPQMLTQKLRDDHGIKL